MAGNGGGGLASSAIGGIFLIVLLVGGVFLVVNLLDGCGNEGSRAPVQQQQVVVTNPPTNGNDVAIAGLGVAGMLVLTALGFTGVFALGSLWTIMLSALGGIVRR